VGTLVHHGAGSAALHPLPDLTAHQHHGLGCWRHADCSGLPAMASGGPPGRATTSSPDLTPHSCGCASPNASARHPHPGPRQEPTNHIRGSVDPGS
jgi:hypothetical protein